MTNADGQPQHAGLRQARLCLVSDKCGPARYLQNTYRGRTESGRKHLESARIKSWRAEWTDGRADTNA